MSLHLFLEARGITVNTYNIHVGAVFPFFHDVFPRARSILPGCVYEYFSEQDGYDFLPFKHVQLYVDEDVPDSLIWVCRYCNFWCEVKNKNLYELHRGINKTRKEWEKEHQLVIENKCSENKNKKC
jgi:hypothetical protein